jgi:signal transduction histidine kinase/DNA-binding response OmpR family regulator
MPGSSAGEDPVRVLVVDDDEKNLQAMAALLARVPAEVVLARSGEDALRRLLAGDFAVILLDVQMPGMSGLETAALIRERERSRRTPIIFLTAFTRTEAQLLGAYRLGAVDFLTKPVLPEEVLREKVAWFVESHRQSARLDAERARAREAEHREHERAVVEAKRRGEAAALRSEMQRQRELAARLHRANERLHVVSSIASGLLFADDPARVLPQLSDVLAARLGLDVYLLHRAGPDGALSLAAHGGVPPEALEALAATALERQPFAAAAARREAVVVEDAAQSEAWPELGRLGLSAAASFPLLATDRLLGAVTFGSRQASRLDPDLLAALELSAEHFASALERARLVEELRRRADDLAEADRHKDEFLAMLGHELRNPLAPVVNGLEILRDDRAGDGARLRALEAADRQVRHLVRLVDDLVDVSRIRNGKVELRRGHVELGRIVEDAVAAVEPLARAQDQALAVELPAKRVVLDGDAVRLTQVVENLLQNATKYTDPGGHIRLAATVDAAGLLLRITDDGIGIAPDLLPRIFETFVQGRQPPNRARGGLGLGLTLVRSLVEMHGGTVRATSEGPGRGSTFEVRLPVVAEAPPPEPRPPPRDGLAPGARLNIAVIEDNPDIRDTVRELLELAGHRVCVAADGRAGVALLLAERPDVALVDIGLPGLDGYEVARQVRGACATRLVALTGYGAHGDRERAAGAGFDAHLVKPVEFEELAAVVERLANAQDRGATPPRAEAGDQPCQSS